MRRFRVLLTSGAVLCVAAATPTPSLAATTPGPSPHATPSTVCSVPCVDPPAGPITIVQAVDRTSATVGDTVSYTITVADTGPVPAAAVTIDDVLGGGARFVVGDGTAGTVNTFLGTPLTTITRVVPGHYRWSYPLVQPGDSDIVRFSLVIRAPLTPVTGVVALTSSASTPGAVTATVSTTVSLPARVPAGGVRGARTGVPPTGSAIDGAAVGFLLLGGLGLVLLGLHVRRRTVLV